jgi:four helix bundle protein
MEKPLNKHEEKALAQTLDHEKLDVYQLSLAFVRHVAPILKRLPPESANDADQLRRSATSVPRNIAEGCGRVGAADKSRYYAFAKGSATESGATLDVLRDLGEISMSEHMAGATLIKRIVAMLVKLAQSVDERR